MEHAVTHMFKESDMQIVHMYPANREEFPTSTALVQHAIDTQTPLVALCGDEWMPESIAFLNGEVCLECIKINRERKNSQ